MKRSFVLTMALALLLAACAQPAPEVFEKEVIVEKEVPVTVEVKKEVIVEKPVVETVEVEKQVIVEKEVPVTVEVEKEVVVEKEVTVEKEVPVTVEVEKEVMVEKEVIVEKEVEVTRVVQVIVTATPPPASPTPKATPTPTIPKPTATATPRPTAAPPPPTSTPTPAISLTLSGMRYEQWGRPVEGCRRFDDDSAVRKFNVEVTLANNSTQAVKEWFPDFYANTGRLLLTCFYMYGGGETFPSVPPGEERTVTFASFAELHEYVEEMRVTVLDNEYRRCFSPEGALISCP